MSRRSSSSTSRVRDIPVYPAAVGLRASAATLVMLASNESPIAPLPQVLEAVERACARVNRYPDPDADARCAARCATATACPRRASRSATAPARSCSPPARRCSSRAPRSSTPGRRSRCIRTWRPRRARARSRVPLNDADEHDLDAMAREITAATRIVIVCNPNNPTATALPPAAIDDVRRQAAAPRLRDPRRGLRASSRRSTIPTTSLDLLERHPNLVLLRTFSKVYGLCGLRVGYALRLGGLPRRGRPRAPAVLRATRSRRPPRLEALQPRGRASRAASSGRRRAPAASRTGLRRDWASAAESQANFCLGRPRVGRPRTRREIVDGLAERGVIVRAGEALGGPGCAARDLRHPPGERPLPRRARTSCSEHR